MSYGTQQAGQLQNLLSQYGSKTNASIRRETASTYDPVTGAETGGTPTITTLDSAKLPLTKTLLADERIRATDTRLIIDNTVAPLESDTIIIDSQDYVVIVINKHKPADDIVGYEVICRG